MQLTPDRSALSLSFPLFVGVVLGVGFLYGVNRDFVTVDKFDELALGQKKHIILCECESSSSPLSPPHRRPSMYW